MPTPSMTDRPSGSSEGVGDVVYGRIRAEILFGQLAPGERLRLDEASRRYGISVGTMRELLNRLASEGLVVAETQRGFEVAPASPSEFREVAALRILLEEHALALSFAKGDLDWEALVVAAHHKLAVTENRMLCGQETDPTLVRQCDRAFHQALISACGSRLLIETHSSMHDRYLRYVSLADIFRGEVSIGEHAELLQCALARNVRRAVEILQVHVGSCVDYAVSEALAPVPAQAGAGRTKPLKAAGRSPRRVGAN